LILPAWHRAPSSSRTRVSPARSSGTLGGRSGRGSTRSTSHKPGGSGALSSACDPRGEPRASASTSRPALSLNCCGPPSVKRHELGAFSKASLSGRGLA
jgi:hypothetical protein